MQGGDPEGTGRGGESIYGEPFKDEFHSRLRYTRRGLVGMANSGKNDNASQFFFTLGATPELQNQNTLFGKVTGDTVFNMLKLEEGMVDQDERPLYPHKIIKAIILNNPFDDIVPRVTPKQKHESGSDNKSKKKKEKGVKNFGLLSFGDEAEEEEKEADDFIQKNIGSKPKSTHDVLDDPKLSKESVKLSPTTKRAVTPELDGDTADEPKRNRIEAAAIRDKLKAKLQSHDASSSSKDKVKSEKEIAKPVVDSSSDDENVLDFTDKEKRREKEQKMKEIRNEISKLKKDYKSEKQEKVKEVQEVEKKEQFKNELVQDYLSEKEKYINASKNIPKKGKSREDQTLALLAKFKQKLQTVRESVPEKKEDDTEASTAKDVDDVETGDNWLAHELKFESQLPVLAKDASTKGDDWYDVFDPRNPLNKRKRKEESNRHSTRSGDSKQSRRR